MTETIAQRERRRQARMRRRKYLLNPANKERDKERSRKRYAEKKKRKAALEFILDKTITLSEFQTLEAKAPKESV